MPFLKLPFGNFGGKKGLFWTIFNEKNGNFLAIFGHLNGNSPEGQFRGKDFQTDEAWILRALSPTVWNFELWFDLKRP